MIPGNSKMFLTLFCIDKSFEIILSVYSAKTSLEIFLGTLKAPLTKMNYSDSS